MKHGSVKFVHPTGCSPGGS